MKISKDMENLEIADLLRAVSASYEIANEKENKFKIIAYDRAADAVEHMSSEAKDLFDDGKLTEVAGVGQSIAKHLGEIFRTGKSKHFVKIMKNIPSATFELIKISGIGPKTAIKLAEELKISTKHPIDDLYKKAKNQEVSRLDGFGEDTEKSIIKSIEELRGREVRLLLPYAEEIANEVLNWMKKHESTISAEVLGSLRRRTATIGDVDIAVSSNLPERIIEHFCKYPKSSRTLEKGDKKASIILPGNRQVDLIVQSPGSFGSLLQHFTGSKQHNIALREYALKKEMSLSENGVKNLKTGKLSRFPDEKSFYVHLGMDWIPSELREDAGEIEAAIEDNLPNLIDQKDIRGDLQIHSNFDTETSHDLGLSEADEIIKKANELEYEYVAFTEHNPSKSGHKEVVIYDILKRKMEWVEQINNSLKNSKGVKHVFNSLEIDILSSGELAIPSKALEYIDFALVSIHSGFKQNRKTMTDRIISSLSHKKTKIFAHPTARKIGKREGVEIDWSKLFEFCLKNNKWLEINADPMRLDLPDMLVRDAIKAGVKLTLGTDAHSAEMMENMRYGVDVARRGWAASSDIVNSRSLEEFMKMIKQ